jgi:hypothetical protein
LVLVAKRRTRKRAPLTPAQKKELQLKAEKVKAEQIALKKEEAALQAERLKIQKIIKARLKYLTQIPEHFPIAWIRFSGNNIIFAFKDNKSNGTNYKSIMRAAVYCAWYELIKNDIDTTVTITLVPENQHKKTYPFYRMLYYDGRTLTKLP